MKLGVLADIHANTVGLEESLRLLKDCDQIICAGDISDQCRFEAKAVNLLFDSNALSIKGNHDFGACSNPLIRMGVSNQPDLKWLNVLERLPVHCVFSTGELRIGIFHGSPWDAPERDYFHYVFSQNIQDIDRVATAGFDLVILGHTHEPMLVERNGTLILNPGSCGCGNSPTCAAIDTATRDVEFRALDK